MSHRTRQSRSTKRRTRDATRTTPYPRTIDPRGGSQEEDSWAGEDSQGEEDTDSLEEGDTPEGEEYHPGDHQEEDGDRHQFPYNNSNVTISDTVTLLFPYL